MSGAGTLWDGVEDQRTMQIFFRIDLELFRSSTHDLDGEQPARDSQGYTRTWTGWAAL
jgi:hypothetical protein